jgi:hypothetical protein
MMMGGPSHPLDGYFALASEALEWCDKKRSRVGRYCRPMIVTSRSKPLFGHHGPEENRLIFTVVIITRECKIH